jgi:putative heme-binding domain-containing protein
MRVIDLLLTFIMAAGVLFAQRPDGRPASPGPEAAFPGNAAQGKIIFEEGGCLGCHRVAGQGSRLGPNLTELGQLGRSTEELEKSILEPDAEIQPQNRFYRVVTADGATITGRLLNHDTFSVQLIDSKEQLRTFQKSELREYGFVKNSPMPSYRGKLTSGELTDVIAYLSSLKGITKQ